MNHRQITRQVSKETLVKQQLDYVWIATMGIYTILKKILWSMCYERISSYVFEY